MDHVDLIAFLQESNKIEGLGPQLSGAQITAAQSFLDLEIITVADMENIVRVFQPDAVLRDRVGLDVRVGNHVPMKGGPLVRHTLAAVLEYAADSRWGAYAIHQKYEQLHPFTDGNGRSGRLLWLWMMLQEDKYDPRLGFLHTWYYQSLSEGGR